MQARSSYKRKNEQINVGNADVKNGDTHFGFNGVEKKKLRPMIGLDEIVTDHKKLLRQVIAEHTPFPEERFYEDGIIICAGGMRYFPSAWVCIRMLRHLGCKLPIQLWHLGRGEMDEKMQSVLEPYDVTVVDGLEIRKIFPARILNGWELKSYSIIHCPFARVLLLDADVVPVSDPTFLFSCPEFRETGAIFWPDYGRLEENREIWEACGIAFRDEPEFESGQIVVEKRRCWKALQITMHMNEHSDFYYNLVHGDKETFHMGFLCADTPYSMPLQPIESLEATMCQHDFQGERLFQHRNLAKWELFGENIQIDGFLLEAECRAFLKELLLRWDGYNQRVPRYIAEGKTETELAAAASLALGEYRYARIGFDERTMTFLPDGRIGQGRQGCEVFWDIREEDEQLTLILSGPEEITCTLRREDGAWRGNWLVHEQMPIVMARECAKSRPL